MITTSDISTPDSASAEVQFAALIEKYAALINRICYSYSECADDLKDLRQDVYINIWRGLSSFRGDSSETTWIYRIVLNTCVSTVRKKSRRISASSFSSMMVDIADDAESSDSMERIEQLRQMISGLSPLDKAIITMWLDERSYEEIASVCGLNRNTVAVRINRIKTKLKNNYER